MKTNMRILLHEKIHYITHRERFIKLLLLALFLLSALSLFAQSNQLETEKGLVEAIAPFDANVRISILIASEYPHVLTQLKNSQTQTAESFQKMIGRYRQQKQEWFYTITRYPELMHRLASLPAKQTQEQIYKLLPNQDPDLQQAAWKLYKSSRKNLAKLDNIRINANREFEKSIAHLNAQAREAFHQLEAKPDVLTLLTNNPDLTAQLGAQYKHHPSEVTNQLAALHDKLEIQNERDAAAFKKQIESDPKAAKELRQASSAYMSNPYYNNPYYYPYSYWFGYPYWYGYPLWYPAMMWYYPGFYFGVGGLYGFPSYGFSFWFYNSGYYTRYPHLYRQFGTYYENHVTALRQNMTIANRGFMNVATSHYSPNTRVAATSPYAMPSNMTRFNRTNSINHSSVNMNHAQPWSIVGGRSNIGGSIGGGFHGGIHGGRR